MSEGQGTGVGVSGPAGGLQSALLPAAAAGGGGKTDSGHNDCVPVRGVLGESATRQRVQVFSPNRNGSSQVADGFREGINSDN